MIFERRAHLFRHVVIVFSQRDLDPDELLNWTEAEYGDQEAQDSPEVNFHYMRKMHCRAVLNMGHSMDYRFDRLQRMSNLISIKLDVSSLYCPLGCCRVGILTMLFAKAVPFNLLQNFANTKMVVTGLWNREEDERVQRYGYTTHFVERIEEDSD